MLLWSVFHGLKAEVYTNSPLFAEYLPLMKRLLPVAAGKALLYENEVPHIEALEVSERIRSDMFSYLRSFRDSSTLLTFCQ